MPTATLTADDSTEAKLDRLMAIHAEGGPQGLNCTRNFLAATRDPKDRRKIRAAIRKMTKAR